jgi:hypothetical protein
MRPLALAVLLLAAARAQAADDDAAWTWVETALAGVVLTLGAD